MPRKNPSLNPFLEIAIIENAIAYLHAIDFKGLHKENMDNIAQLCHLSDRSVVRKILRNNKLHPDSERVTKNTKIEIPSEIYNKIKNSRIDFLGKDFAKNIINENCIGLCMKTGYVALTNYKLEENKITFSPFVVVNDVMLEVFFNILKQFIYNSKKEEIDIFSYNQIFIENFLIKRENFYIKNKENNITVLSKKNNALIFNKTVDELCVNS